MKIPDWTPRDSDVTWLRNILAVIKEGGIWAVPMTGSIYTVSHLTKTMTLSLDPGTPESEDLHSKNATIGKIIGWKVHRLESHEPPPYQKT